MDAAARRGGLNWEMRRRSVRMKPVTQGDDDALRLAWIHWWKGCRWLMPGAEEAKRWGSPQHLSGDCSEDEGSVTQAPAASAPRPLPGGRRQGITDPWGSCPCRRTRLGPLRPVCGSGWWTRHAPRRRGRCPPPCSQSNGRHILPSMESTSACLAVSRGAEATKAGLCPLRALLENIEDATNEWVNVVELILALEWMARLPSSLVLGARLSNHQFSY